MPFYWPEVILDFLVIKKLLEQTDLQSVPEVFWGHVSYSILYDLTSVRRHLKLRAKHLAGAAAHEHAL